MSSPSSFPSSFKASPFASSFKFKKGKTRFARSEFVLVTGASAGFGRAIVIEYAKFYFSKSKTNQPRALLLSLISRSEEGLVETTTLTQIASGCFSKSTDINMETFIDGSITVRFVNDNKDQLYIHILPLDLSIPENKFKKLCRNIFVIPDSLTRFDAITQFHNAGSVGDLRFIQNLSIKSMQNVIRYATLNLFSVMMIVQASISWMKKLFPQATSRIINISSLAAIKPFPSWSWYCSLKAARDMFIQVLATEIEAQKDLPVYAKINLKTLNYAPGMLNTNMQAYLRKPTNTDYPSHSTYFSKVFKEGQLIEPTVSARKLLFIVEHDGYDSGAHIDYWDKFPQNDEGDDDEDSEEGADENDIVQSSSTKSTVSSTVVKEDDVGVLSSELSSSSNSNSK